MTEIVGTAVMDRSEQKAGTMLSVDLLRKTFDGGKKAKNDPGIEERVYAVDEVSFDVEVGELFTLLGPSGCGKTTTLRSIAGLERPTSGRISLDGKAIFDSARGINVPANQRGVGMVFQSYAIWPHMTVRKNVAFPLEVLPAKRRPKAREINERVDRALHVTELGAYADRPATKLSGGQQQRLALARALVIEPPVMLLDEPLSNLDAKLREAMRAELKRLQREIGVTTIYVTHDQVEALALSSRIAVMDNGKVLQVGKPRDIYERPANRFVAGFIGTANFVHGSVVKVEGAHQSIKTDTGEVLVATPFDGAALTPGTRVVVSIRPECLNLSEGPAPANSRNSWSATVASRSFLGDSVDHVLSLAGLELAARSNPSQSFAVGTVLQVHVSPDKAVILPEH